MKKLILCLILLLTCQALLAGPGVYEYSFSSTSPSVGYDPATGLALNPAVVQLRIEEGFSNPNFPNTMIAFSMGLTHDSDFLTVTNVSSTPFLRTGEQGGGEPFFFSTNYDNQGLTVAVAFSFEGSLQFSSRQSVIEVEYEVDASSLLSNSMGMSTELEWNNSLGNPPIPNQVAYNGTQTIDALLENGSVTLRPILADEFIRGDCNQDSIVNLADCIYLLESLFSAGPPPPCEASCDVNESISTNIADGVILLHYLFSSGTAPAQPFPDCGAGVGFRCNSSLCP